MPTAWLLCGAGAISSAPAHVYRIQRELQQRGDGRREGWAHHYRALREKVRVP